MACGMVDRKAESSKSNRVLSADSSQSIVLLCKQKDQTGPDRIGSGDFIASPELKLS